MSNQHCDKFPIARTPSLNYRKHQWTLIWLVWQWGNTTHCTSTWSNSCAFIYALLFSSRHIHTIGYYGLIKKRTGFLSSYVLSLYYLSSKPNYAHHPHPLTYSAFLLFLTFWLHISSFSFSNKHHFWCLLL